MPEYTYGPQNTGRWLGYPEMYSTGFWLPNARAHANGSKRIKVDHVRAWVSGVYVGSQTPCTWINVRVGDASAEWGISRSNYGADSGWRRSNDWWVDAYGQETTIVYNPNGGGLGISFGSIADGNRNIHNWNGVVVWSGIRFAAGILYRECPSQCGQPQIRDDGSGRVYVWWGGPGDDGGTGLWGYTLQRSTTSNFSSNVFTEYPGGTSWSGQLTEGETWYFRVAARNEVTNNASSPGGPWSATSSVYPRVTPPSWTDVVLANTMRQGTPYSDGVSATDTTPSTHAITYSVSSGALPSGLSLDTGSGAITGTPSSGTAGQTYSFTLRATNTGGSIDQSYTRTVLSVTSAWTDNVLATEGRVGSTYSDSVSASGTGVTYSISDGSLPPGIELGTSSGTVSGTPTTPGDYTFTITATNISLESVSQEFTLTIKPSGRRFTSQTESVFITNIARYDGTKWVPAKNIKKGTADDTWINLESN